MLTGGPCSGKTSSLAHLKQACHEQGYEWYMRASIVSVSPTPSSHPNPPSSPQIPPTNESLTVPEVPTILIEGGAAYPGLQGGRRLIQFEVALLRLQLQVEESFAAIARSLDKPAVLIADRGAL